MQLVLIPVSLLNRNCLLKGPLAHYLINLPYIIITRSILLQTWRSAPCHSCYIILTAIACIEDHCHVSAVHIRLVDLIGADCLL